MEKALQGFGGGVQQGGSCGILNLVLSARVEAVASVNVWRVSRWCPMVGASAKGEYSDRIHGIWCVE